MLRSWSTIEDALQKHRPRRILRDAVRAAVAMVLRVGERGIELLFIRRAEHSEDPWSGHMAFPGGRRESQDADLRATAVRETQEELGLDLLRNGRYLGELDEIDTLARPRGVDLTITPFVFRIDRSGPLLLNDEVRSAHWIALAALGAEENQSSLLHFHEGRNQSFPCIRLDDHVIWGLTYRMLRGFEEIIRASDPRGCSDTER